MFFKNTFVFPLKQISIFIIDAFEYSGEKVMMTKWPKFLHKLFSSEMSIYMQTVILVSADVFFIHTCIYMIRELEVLFFCWEIIMKRFSAFSSSLIETEASIFLSWRRCIFFNHSPCANIFSKCKIIFEILKQVAFIDLNVTDIKSQNLGLDSRVLWTCN